MVKTATSSSGRGVGGIFSREGELVTEEEKERRRLCAASGPGNSLPKTMDDSGTWRRVGLDVIHAETVVKELVQNERNDDDDVGEERERTDSEREDDDDEIEAAATSPAHEENFASNSPSPSLQR